LFETDLSPSPRWKPTVSYLMQIEAHVYALAIAASTLLSFYPFVIVILGFFRSVLRWPAAVDAVYLALNDYLPGDLGDYVRHNLPRRAGAVASMFLLLFSANGVFLPLEVALNRTWGAVKNRSYWKNQVVALGLIVVCGGLALISLMLTALNKERMLAAAGKHATIQVWMNLAFFKMAALPISILALFLVYWLLPNCKVPPVRVVPGAILAGVFLEALKYIDLGIWPLLRDKLQREYGVFHYAVSILLWSFIGALGVLAAAEWTARQGQSASLKSE
jgi:membrane protein